jgi:hypothetical protein
MGYPVSAYTSEYPIPLASTVRMQLPAYSRRELEKATERSCENIEGKDRDALHAAIAAAGQS